jgi:hypothetical protein
VIAVTGLVVLFALPFSKQALAQKISATEESDSRAAFSACHLPVPGVPTNHLFRNLRTAYLAVNVLPRTYIEALRCHGQENMCLEQSGTLKVDPQRRQEFLDHMVANYNAYPKPLHPDALTTLFAASLKQKLSVAILPGLDCKTRDPILLDHNGLETFWKDDQNGKSAKDSLLVLLNVQIFDDTKPRIAVLSVLYYRPGETMRSQFIESRTLPVPLDMPGAETSKLVEGLAQKFLTVWIGEE